MTSHPTATWVQMSIATRREVTRKQRRRLRLRLLARRNDVEQLPEQRRPMVVPPSRARS